MSRVDEIFNLIEQLSTDEFAELEQRLAEEDWRAWDKQVEQDASSGRLDFLLEQARRAREAGEVLPLE